MLVTSSFHFEPHFAPWFDNNNNDDEEEEQTTRQNETAVQQYTENLSLQDSYSLIQHVFNTSTDKINRSYEAAESSFRSFDAHSLKKHEGDEENLEILLQFQQNQQQIDVLLTQTLLPFYNEAIRNINVPILLPFIQDVGKIPSMHLMNFSNFNSINLNIKKQIILVKFQQDVSDIPIVPSLNEDIHHKLNTKSFQIERLRLVKQKKDLFKQIKKTNLIINYLHEIKSKRKLFMLKQQQILRLHNNVNGH
jgi:hypothetical protein